ncbi:MAG: YidE/YbjL duplication [Desulfocapsa sp.]|nr:MAG: YidE/YbjL duplication [Desulfocapsa sp.]
MEIISSFLNTQPFIALFLVIGVGYLVGKIQISGFSLGIGAILFVGLAVGAVAPESVPPSLLGLVGLILFLYGIGIQYGKHFFAGLASSLGIKANILAATAVLAGFGASLVVAKYLGFSHDYAAGMFAGTLTSTPSLQAALVAAGNMDPAVGYATAYPFGVFGPILFFYLTHRLLRPKVEVKRPARLVTAEITVDEANLEGQDVAQVLENAPEGVELLLVRRQEINFLPAPDFVFRKKDVLLVAGLPEDINKLQLQPAENAISDRRHLDYVRVFVSKAKYVGTPLADIVLPENCSAKIVHIRRGDIDLMPGPELIIEYGDQLGVLVDPAKRETIAAFFGDSIQAESSFCFISLSIGMLAGALIGLIPLPVPGLGSVKFGTAGGVLIMSLILGYYGRLGPLNWNMPVVANLILRNFGLTLFLAGVGMSSGAPFIKNFGGVGLSLLIGGILVVALVVLFIILVGYYILRINFDDLLGIAAGATGNPAILSYANELTPTGKPDIGYAMIFPGVGTILKIILVQIMVALANNGGIPPVG